MRRSDVVCNYWTDTIKTKEMIEIVTHPVAMRYLGLQFDEMVVASLHKEIDDALMRYSLNVFCEIKISTSTLLKNNTTFETISGIKINYLHENFL